MKSNSVATTTPPVNGDTLEEFLKDKLKRASEDQIPPMSVLDLLKIDPQAFHSPAPLIWHDMSKGLEDLIAADTRFLGSAARMVNTLNGASGFYPRFVGVRLLKRMVATGSASAAIAWLQKVLSTQSADGEYITALWNVPVTAEVEVTPRVRLVPFDLLPNSAQKAAIENSQFGEEIITTSLSWQPPSSALVMPVEILNFLVDGESEPDYGEYQSLHDSAAEITWLLTLVGPRVPIQVAHWFNYKDQDLEFALSGGGRGMPAMEILPRLAAQSPPILNAEEAVEIIWKFRTLALGAKAKIKVATDRLRRALLRHNSADRAVEVSIALEIMCGDTQTNEMTHKVKTRVVRLLGGDASLRERNRVILTKTYEVRSKLVHQGSQDTKPISVQGTPTEVDAVVTEACHLCAELIKKVIRHGAFPDWLRFDINDHGSGLLDAEG
jgi:hypothetical protein